MATDARGHTVPAASDVPSRTTLLNLALSVNDFVSVTNTTTRATLATAVTPTTARPLIVARADARPDSELEYTTDGTTWKTLAIGSGIQTYTPALTAPTTNPTLSTGSSIVGSYYTFGPWVIGTFDINCGTAGFVAGSGIYEVSLPIAAPAGAPTAGTVAGSGLYVDASPLGGYTIALRFQTTTTVRMFVTGTTGISAVAPVVPANNDKFNGTFMYLAN